MNIKYAYLLAGALALGFVSLTHAEDKPAKPEAGTEGRRAGGFDREQREKMAKDLGLNPEELKNLPQEERWSKIREAAEKKRTELKKKQEAGTITEDEKATLKRLEERRGGGAEGRGGFSPEQTEKMLKEIGLNPDDLKNLSREERWAKIKEASYNKHAELEKKQAAGTITDAEKEQLKKMDERRKMMRERGGDRGGRREGKPGEDKK